MKISPNQSDGKLCLMNYCFKRHHNNSSKADTQLLWQSTLRFERILIFCGRLVLKQFVKNLVQKMNISPVSLYNICLQHLIKSLHCSKHGNTMEEVSKIPQNIQSDIMEFERNHPINVFKMNSSDFITTTEPHVPKLYKIAMSQKERLQPKICVKQIFSVEEIPKIWKISKAVLQNTQRHNQLLSFYKIRKRPPLINAKQQQKLCSRSYDKDFQVHHVKRIR